MGRVKAQVRYLYAGAPHALAFTKGSVPRAPLVVSTVRVKCRALSLEDPDQQQVQSGAEL